MKSDSALINTFLEEYNNVINNILNLKKNVYLLDIIE